MRGVRRALQSRQEPVHRERNTRDRRPISKTCIGCQRTFVAARQRIRYCSRACARSCQVEAPTFDPAALIASPDQRTRDLIRTVTKPRTGRLARERVAAIDELLAVCLLELASE